MNLKICLVIILFLTIIMKLGAPCSPLTDAYDTMLVIGEELEAYADINTYIKIDITNPPIYSDLFSNNYLIYSRYYGDIGIEIFTSYDTTISTRTATKIIRKLFTEASTHLSDNFGGLIVSRKMYYKILACCIEYGMRKGNTKYLETDQHIDCVSVLGLDGSNKNNEWISNKWKEKKIWQIVI